VSRRHLGQADAPEHESSGHAQTRDERPPRRQLSNGILAPPAHCNDAVSYERPIEAHVGRSDDDSLESHFDAVDGFANDPAGEASYNRLDFGKFRHLIVG
jgi:hypothetical protein